MESKINFNLSDKKQSIRYKSEERKSKNLSRNFTISNNKMNKKLESSLRVIIAKILLKNRSTINTNKDKLYLPFFKTNANNYENINSAKKTEKSLPIKKYNHIVNGFRLSFRKKLLTLIKNEDKKSLLKSEKKLNPITTRFRENKFKKLKLFIEIKEEESEKENEDIKEDEKEINTNNKSEIKLKRKEINNNHKNNKMKENKSCLTNIIMAEEKDNKKKL